MEFILMANGRKNRVARLAKRQRLFSKTRSDLNTVNNGNENVKSSSYQFICLSFCWLKITNPFLFHSSMDWLSLLLFQENCLVPYLLAFNFRYFFHLDINKTQFIREHIVHMK